MWVIDNPWPPFFILIIAAALIVWRWSRVQRPVFLVAAGCLMLLAAGVHVVDTLVVTEGEVIEDNVHQMVAAFQAKDREKTKSFLAPNVQPAAVPSIITSAMDIVRIHGDIDVKDLRVEVQRNNTSAKSRFRANATVSHGNSRQEHQPSRWEFTWERIGQDWKVVRVARLDYINDREVSLLYPLSGEMRQ